VGVDKLGSYGRISAIESQTYEDPMILAMNLFLDPEENRNCLIEQIGFT
jgi:serine protein kinase